VEAEKKGQKTWLNILSDSVGLQRMQVGTVEHWGGRVALRHGRGREVVGMSGNGAEKARRRRGRAAGGPQGKRRQLRQLRVERRLRLWLRLLAVHAELSRAGSQRGAVDDLEEGEREVCREDSRGRRSLEDCRVTALVEASPY
jgi:hypothetical protein